MDFKKTIIASLATATGAVLTAAVPEVTGVTMTQATDRLVTISYTLADAPAVITVDIQTNATGVTWASIGGENIQQVTGDVWKKVETGVRTIKWHPDLSWPDHKIAAGGARAVVTAWALDNTPDYMVVDISVGAQPNTQQYYPTAGFVPGGVSNYAYKTSALLMRKIMARNVTWWMGSTVSESGRATNGSEDTHQVSLTNSYYIGVYPVTQSQWGEVATNSAAKAFFTVEGSMRPMEYVAFNEIRNSHSTSASATSVSAVSGYDWPAPPSDDSFLGLLRLKTGLDFDLPSDAQWEFAARAGHGSGYWNDGTAIVGGNLDTNLDDLGCYLGNSPSGVTDRTATGNETPTEGGTQIVGSYLPSSFGLYDMHGNVYEWCLDYMANDIGSLGGGVNTTYATYKVVRGGAWYVQAKDCRSAARVGSRPASRYNFGGFRVVCTAGQK